MFGGICRSVHWRSLRLPQTCLKVWWASPDRHFILWIWVFCSHILLSPLNPNTTHQSTIMNDCLKGISYGTPPHSLLIHLSFQRVKMNSSLSILDNRKELCDCFWRLTDWLFVYTLKSLFHPLLPPSVFYAHAHTSSPFSHIFPFSSIISITSHPQELIDMSKNIHEPLFRPLKTGKTHKNVIMGKREGVTE